MLQQEYSTAGNIKARANRKSVQAAIVAAQQCVKKYKTLPPHGLAILASATQTHCFEPPKPVRQFLYLCDKQFHTHALHEMCKDEAERSTFGMVIVDGHGALYGLLTNDERTILHKASVHLPSQHGRGGQSQARFGRLVEEKRDLWAKKCAEQCVDLFVAGGTVGLILAGSAGLKNQLYSHLPVPLQNLVCGFLDTSFGGEAGFEEAASKSRTMVREWVRKREENSLTVLYKAMATDGKFVAGLQDSMRAFHEMKIVETLLVSTAIDAWVDPAQHLFYAA